MSDELEALYERWLAGEKVGALAKEQDMPWQRLHARMTAHHIERSRNMVKQSDAQKAAAAAAGNGEYADLFNRFAAAISDHLKPTVDEGTVRGMIDEAVAKARMPRPIEVHLPDGKTVKVEGKTHMQFERLLYKPPSHQ